MTLDVFWGHLHVLKKLLGIDGDDGQTTGSAAKADTGRSLDVDSVDDFFERAMAGEIAPDPDEKVYRVGPMPGPDAKGSLTPEQKQMIEHRVRSSLGID